MIELPRLPYIKSRTLSCYKFVCSDRAVKAVLKDIMDKVRSDTEEEGACNQVKSNQEEEDEAVVDPLPMQESMMKDLMKRMSLEDMLEFNFDYVDFNVATEEMVSYIHERLASLKQILVKVEKGKKAIHCKSKSVTWSADERKEFLMLVVGILKKYSSVVASRIDFLNGILNLFLEEIMGIIDIDDAKYSDDKEREHLYNATIFVKVFFEAVVVQEVDGLNRLWNDYICPVYEAVYYFLQYEDNDEEEVNIKNKLISYVHRGYFDKLYGMREVVLQNVSPHKRNDTFDWRQIENIFLKNGPCLTNPTYMCTRSIFTH